MMLRYLMLGCTLLHLASMIAVSHQEVLSLQVPNPKLTPSSVLSSLADDCAALAVTSFDVYGDFSEGETSSYLRRFEAEVAREFGMEDAVFMPSGVMAQSIALLIHRGDKNGSRRFACHESSHLLLHEQQGYRFLLEMDSLVIGTPVTGFRKRPLLFADVERELKKHSHETSTLILELPHRELGGKCTPWHDVMEMSKYCKSQDIRFHCDGARIFESTVAYEKSLKDLAEPFDSMYISFYKGLAGISGAMLLGPSELCVEARVWLRRFGGNLYTLLPYAVSGWAGFRKHWVKPSMSFGDKRNKLVRIVNALTSDADISSCVVFDPQVPQLSMVHGYLCRTKEECTKAVSIVESKHGIRVLSRLRDVEPSDPAYREGYRTKFEWTMGEANGSIDDDVFTRGWRGFAAALEAHIESCPRAVLS